MTAKEAIEYLDLRDGKGKLMSVDNFMKEYAGKIGYYCYSTKYKSFRESDLDKYMNRCKVIDIRTIKSEASKLLFL